MYCRYVKIRACLGKGQPFPKQALVFTCLQYNSFENIVGKREIARNKQFLLFPQCVLPVSITFLYFHQIWNCRLQTLWVRKSLKIVVWERVNSKDQLESESNNYKRYYNCKSQHVVCYKTKSSKASFIKTKNDMGHSSPFDTGHCLQFDKSLKTFVELKLCFNTYTWSLCLFMPLQW